MVLTLKEAWIMKKYMLENINIQIFASIPALSTVEVKYNPPKNQYYINYWLSQGNTMYGLITLEINADSVRIMNSTASMASGKNNLEANVTPAIKNELNLKIVNRDRYDHDIELWASGTLVPKHKYDDLLGEISRS